MYYKIKHLNNNSIVTTKICCDEIEQRYLEENKVIKEKDFEFHNEPIYSDDTVENIKYKIKKAMGFSEDLNELYLFSQIKIKLTSSEVYNILSQNQEIEINYSRFVNFLTNFYEINVRDIEEKEIYTYDDIVSLKLDKHEKILEIPIGVDFNIEKKYYFASNPFNTIVNDDFLAFNSLDIVSTQNKKLLFEYGNLQDNTLFVCTAEDVLTFADSGNELYFINIYFPFLAETKKTTFSEIVSSRKVTDFSSVNLYNKKIDLLNSIYNSQTPALTFTDQKITTLNFIIHPNIDILIPLNIIFKIINTNEKQPVIKFNTSNKSEKLYKLYSPTVASNGKRIPMLPKSTIQKFGQNFGKKKSLAIYYEEDNNIIITEMFSNGEIKILFKSMTVETIKKAESFIKTYINSLLKEINITIKKSGYSYVQFDKLDNRNIEILNIELSKQLAIETPIDFERHLRCLSSVISVIQSDLSKDIELEYKRVSYFNEMNSMDKLISNLLIQRYSNKDIIKKLVSNFSISEKEAEVKIADWLQSIKVEQNAFANRKFKLKATSGIPIIIKKDKFTNNLIIEIKEITNLNYIEHITVYLDSLFILAFDKVSSSIAPELINELCVSDAEKQVEIMKDITAPPELGIDERTNVDLDDGVVTFGNDDQGDDLLEEMFGDDDGEMFGDDDEMEFEDLGSIEIESDGEGAKRSVAGAKRPVAGVKTPKDVINIDGMPLNNPNYFFERMKKRDPVLFLKKEKGKYQPYSRGCQHNYKRQPVILTDEEKERIDREYPGSYPKNETFKYGSTPENQYWYICPRYWCLKDNVSLTEEDVRSGKCGGKIIPKNAKKVPKGHYIYEFNVGKKNNEHEDKHGNYIQHYPGFFKPDFHPDGLGVPCCFKSWDKGGQPERRAHFLEKKKIVKKEKVDEIDTTQYVHNELKFPLKNGNIGYLPLSIQKMIGVNNDNCRKHKSDVFIKSMTPCLLRHGVENSEKQSFLACISSFFTKTYGDSSIKKFKHVVKKLLTLDMFVSLQNGSLVNIFYKEGDDSLSVAEFKKKHKKNISILSTVKNTEYQIKLINAFINFHKFIESDDTYIDHTYLWDFVSNHLFITERDSRVNLIIFEMVNDDITNKVDIICPTYSFSQSKLDTKYKNLFIIKNGSYYEPMSLFMLEDKVIKIDGKKRNKYMLNIIRNMFSVYEDDIDIEIKKTIQKVKDYQDKCVVTEKTVYYKDTIDINDIMKLINKNKDFLIIGQILNYNNKVIGLEILHKKEKIMIPIKPTSIQKDIMVKVVGEDDDEIWNDYLTSVKLLNLVSTTFKLPCKPILKVIEDELIVGLITETNQFVSIIPPSENIHEDDIPEYNGINHYDIDSKTLLSNEIDSDREKAIKRIKLETNFFTSFRNTVKIVLNKYENLDVKRRIKEIIKTPNLFYVKLKALDRELKNLMRPYINFIEYDSDTIDILDDIGICVDDTDAGKSSYCFVDVKAKIDVILLPKNHLISGVDNEKIYFGRVVDEMLRYNKIKNYLLNDNVFLNLIDIPYRLNDNEIIVIENLLFKEYFNDLTKIQGATNIKNTYDNVGYIDTNRDLISRSEEKEKKQQLEAIECKKIVRPMVLTDINYKDFNHIGKINIVTFGESATINCVYQLIKDVIHEHIGKYLTKKDIQTILIDEMEQMIETNSNELRDTMIVQGKKHMFHDLKQQKYSIRDLILSNDYYLTNIDLFILCMHFNIAMVIISRTKLRENDNRIMSINYDESKEYVFILKQYGIKDNEIQKYEAIEANSSYKFFNEFLNPSYKVELANNIVKTPFIAIKKKKKKKKTKLKVVLGDGE